MKKYRALKTCFIAASIRQPGDIVELPASVQVEPTVLQLIDAPAEPTRRPKSPKPPKPPAASEEPPEGDDIDDVIG